MKQATKLTARQRAFLDKLMELYHEHQGPVHYTDVAQGLGVNRFSAYDMLKVLEEKGFAESSYALRSAESGMAEHAGPGRSMVVFAPTPLAAADSGPGFDESRLGEDWQRVRERVLERLRHARETSARDTLSDLLARLPDANAPLTFCTEMIGAFLLNMKRVRTRAGNLNPFRVLTTLQTSDAADLETLAGLSVGVALSDEDETSRTMTQRLLRHVRHYQTSLSRLSEESRAALVHFLEEALEALD